MSIIIIIIIIISADLTDCHQATPDGWTVLCSGQWSVVSGQSQSGADLADCHQAKPDGWTVLCSVHLMTR